jgi:hypothetical protein
MRESRLLLLFSIFSDKLASEEPPLTLLKPLEQLPTVLL